MCRRMRRPHTGGWWALAVIPLLALPATRAFAAPVPPSDGRPFPPGVQELMDRDPMAYEYAHAYLQWGERIRENQRKVESGELRPASEEERKRLTSITGTRTMLVLTGMYSDTGSPPVTQANLALRLFNDPFNLTMVDYYSEVSYGALHLQGVVYDWKTAPQTAAYYKGSSSGLKPGNAHTDQFIKSIVQANDAGINYGQYDNDGPDGTPNSGDDDGVVDLLCIAHPEAGAECGGAGIWSHHWQLSGWGGGDYQTNDARFGGGFIRVNDYSVCPAVSCGGGTIEIGVYCHEYGHAFGIPDLYDTKATGTGCTDGGSEGLGWWDLMAAGNWANNNPNLPAHMSAWTKAQLGWLVPSVVTNDLLGFSLGSTTREPVAFKLWSQGKPGKEYFLVENREKINFDAGLPKGGLLIYHVDENVGGGIGPNDLNQNECHPRIDLECADQTGSDHTENADGLASRMNRGDVGDPFCNGGTFSTGTTPSSVSYGGGTTTVTVQNISGCGTTNAKADLLVGSIIGTNDICVRDCFADVCTVPTNGVCVTGWWESPDIYIDNNGDGLQDAPAVNLLNHIFARIRNNGSAPAVNVTVKFYYAFPSVGLNFPSQGTLIGTQTIGQIPSGGTAVAAVDWVIPFDPQHVHWCLGAIATNVIDPQTSEAAYLDNDVAQINAQVLVKRTGTKVPSLSPGLDPDPPYQATQFVQICNDKDYGCTIQLRIGRPPMYNDAVIGPKWTVTVPPSVFVPPFSCVVVPVDVMETDPIHGDDAIIPITGVGCDGLPTGGDVIECRVDNVPPHAPCDFTVQEVADSGDYFPGQYSIDVAWTPSLFDELNYGETVERWRVYRGPSPSFTPDGTNLLAETCIDADPESAPYDYFTDTPADTAYSWYKIVAIDRAGNESDTCLTHIAYSVTSVGEDTPHTRALLLQGVPNPLRTSFGTALHYNLPSAGTVTLAIYSADGRTVRRLQQAREEAGPHSIVWDGRTDTGDLAPAGTYLCRMDYAGRRETVRLVIAR